jgi:hypothetical protein
MSKFKPLHDGRLQHPLEKALREAWETMPSKNQDFVLAGPEVRYNEIPHGVYSEANTLTGGYQPYPYGKMTDRDRMVAAEVMQWLGTHVGFNLLAHAISKAGGKIEYPIQTKP